MKKYLLYSASIVLQLVQAMKATCQVREEFDNLIFSIPAGLTVSKTDNSMLLSDASTGIGQYFTINVNKSTYSLKKIDKSFPVYWRETLLNEGVDNPVAEPAFVKSQTNSGWNCFRGGKLVQYNLQAPSFYYHLIVMRYLGITIRIVSRASSEDLFMQKIPLLMQLVSSVSFKPQAPNQNGYKPAASTQTNNSQQPGPANPVYNQSQSVQLNGLYISLQGDLLQNAELSVLYFLPDGIVYNDIPEKGFYTLNLQQQKTQFPSSFGTYSSTNNSISVQMNNQPNTSTYTIETGGVIKSIADPGQAFKKIATLDGYQFEGRFNNKQGGTNANIVFTRNGQFTDMGLIKTIISKGNENYSSGSGSYSSMQNSLLLRYTDGRQLQLCFYMMPEESQKTGGPDKILLNNYVLVKQ